MATIARKKPHRGCALLGRSPPAAAQTYADEDCTPRYVGQRQQDSARSAQGIFIFQVYEIQELTGQLTAPLA
jgi:hypothetical protein